MRGHLVAQPGEAPELGRQALAGTRRLLSVLRAEPGYPYLFNDFAKISGSVGQGAEVLMPERRDRPRHVKIFGNVHNVPAL